VKQAAQTWVWRAALAALVLGAAWQKHADDLRARALQMRAASETIARLEELRQATGPRTR
jgi:hypothetical protein